MKARSDEIGYGIGALVLICLNPRDKFEHRQYVKGKIEAVVHKKYRCKWFTELGTRTRGWYDFDQLSARKE